MKSLGLDLSATAPGLVLLDKPKGAKTFEVVIAEEIPVPKAADIERYARVNLIANRIADVCIEHKPELIVIEGYGQVSHGGVTSFIKVVEVGTLVRLWLYENGNKWTDVPPSSLKLFVTGKGKLPSGLKGKKEMISGVEKQWGYVTKNHNIADAFGLAVIGLARAGALPVTPAQIDGLDRIQPGGTA